MAQTNYIGRSISVMQPYLFPYIGYYQLLSRSDIFYIYDDVTYIKSGFINRNKILLQGQPFMLTLPVSNASSNKLIRDLQFTKDTKKLKKTIAQAYSKARFFGKVFPIIEEVLDSKNRDISHICRESLQSVFNYLGIAVSIDSSSNIEYDRTLSSENRLLSLLKKVNAKTYINSIGGIALYDKKNFLEQNIDLKFLQSIGTKYDQPGKQFKPNLSIIDVLMWNSKEDVVELLNKCELI